MDDIKDTKKPDPIESESQSSTDGDAVLSFLKQGDIVGDTLINEKALLRKIDWIIMPLTWMSYNLQYMDKTLINFAQQMGLLQDTGMSQDQYSYMALAFYCTYLALELPSGYLMQRLPVAKYLGVNLVIWGLIVTLNCAAKNFAGIMTLRVLLGCFESAIAPGLMLITGMWYKKEEQPLRMGIWYMGCGTAPIIGSLVAYGLLFYTGTAFKAWQILFLVFGLITIATGILVILILPDNPMTCRWLSKEEKLVAIERLRDNKNSIENKHFKWSQFKEVFTDPQTYFLSIYTIAGLIPNGATSSFQGILINSMGFDTKQTQLLTLPGGVVTILVVWVTGWLGGKYNARILWSCITLLVGILGACMLAFLKKSPAGQLAGNYLIFFTTAPLSLSYALVSANYAGHTKKVTMNAVMLMSFCLGNILGPLTFRGRDAPEYVPAKIALIVSMAVSLLFTAALYPYYVWENKRRDKMREEGEVQEDADWMDLTDRENRSFRYSY